MSVYSNNVIVEGLKGLFGGQIVFRTFRGKTFAQSRPTVPYKESHSEAQQETRSNFKRACAWAKEICKDPVQKEKYKLIADKLQLPNAYTAACTEYLRKAEVMDVTIWTEDGRVLSSLSEETQRVEGKNRIEVMARKKGFMLEEIKIEVVDVSGNSLGYQEGVRRGKNYWEFFPTLKIETGWGVAVWMRDSAGRVIRREMKVEERKLTMGRGGWMFRVKE